jgi:predicted acetyltransferase
MTKIKKLAEKHYPEYVKIMAEAYPGMGAVSQEDQARIVKRVKKSARDKRRVLYGSFRDSKMVGVMRLHDFTMNVRGAKVLGGGLGGVAVDLTHKREHVCKEIVEYYLAHYAKKRAPLLTLWPFRADFYRQMGFGLGARMYQYRIKPESIPRGPTKKHVRYLTKDDIPALNDCYNRLFEKRTGMVRETVVGWRNIFELHGDLRFVGCEIGGRIDAYLTYRFQRGKSQDWLNNNLVVIELVYHSAEALAELLTFLHTQFDQVNRVVLHTPDDGFYFLLHDARNDAGNMIPPIYQESHVSGIGIMYRVLSTERLMGMLTDHDFGGVSLKLKLTIRDSFFSDNNGSVLLHFSDGRVRVTDGRKSDVEIGLDVADFSSMLMGAVRFRALHTYGLADISDPSFVDTVDKAFAMDVGPLTMASF